ncbi:MAG TPA: hypothetical protein VMB03_12825 [Bryobacteraceae bacterium]|nr:hypothetical protein [Bryobacteraceae bacterium]
MSPEMQKYNKELERLSTECAADIRKLLSSCRNSIGGRMMKLTAEIEKLPVPGSAGGDLAKVQDIVLAALKKGGTQYASIATFSVRVSVSGNKVSVPAAGISGPLAGIV